MTDLPRKALPPWVHAALGGTVVLTLVGSIILFRSLAAPGRRTDAGPGGDRAAAQPVPAADQGPAPGPRCRRPRSWRGASPPWP